MIVSYDAYRVFYTVARFGSFTKAASVLLASQPNLTRTIRNLESALGCTLFVRSNRGVSLTPEGAKAVCCGVSVACATDSGGRRRAGQRPQSAKRRGFHRRERNGAARLSPAPCWARFIGRIRAFVCAFPTIPRRRRLLR